ncbi:MAG: hypothetical protein QNL90_08965 [Gammaproteobacteria bacterium]|nr:hypothetical protein [Gammaproteobacteria bacterium]MDX2460274.1 hypothetical protein [Gammaproteobacteria bacterium]
MSASGLLGQSGAAVAAAIEQELGEDMPLQALVVHASLNRSFVFDAPGSVPRTLMARRRPLRSR